MTDAAAVTDFRRSSRTAVLILIALHSGACAPEEPGLGPPRPEPAGPAGPAGPASTVEPPNAPEPPRREPLLHVPILHKVAEGSARHPADWSFDLYVAPTYTIHTHVLPEDSLVPLHHHPGGEELVFVAAGQLGWASLVAGERLVGESFRPVAEFAAVHTAPGVAHAVRNEQPRTAAAIVISRPPFAQNRHLLDEDVASEGRSIVLTAGSPIPSGAFSGWTMEWLDAAATSAERVAENADTFYFVGAVSGTLTFEDRTLPVEPGLFVRVPPGLKHRMDVPAEAAASILRVEAPRGG